MMDFKQFPTTAVLSLYTGRLLGDFNEMHELMEFVANRAVYTHEMASEGLWHECQDRLAKQFPWLREINLDAMPESDLYDSEDGFRLALKNWTSYYLDLHTQTLLVASDDGSPLRSRSAETLARLGSKRGQS
jgi:hypothetical protein